jgi:hypothetical protein
LPVQHVTVTVERGEIGIYQVQIFGVCSAAYRKTGAVRFGFCGEQDACLTDTDVLIFKTYSK